MPLLPPPSRALPPSLLKSPPQDLVVCGRPPGLSYISRTAHPNALLLVSHQLHAEYTAPIRASALHSFRLNPLVLHSASFYHFVAPLLSSVRRVSPRRFRIYGRYLNFDEHEGGNWWRAGNMIGSGQGAEWEVRSKCDEPEEPLAERLQHLESYQYLEDWRGVRYDCELAQWQELARLVVGRDAFWKRVHKAEPSEVAKSYRMLVDATWANWMTLKKIRQIESGESAGKDAPRKI